MNGARDGGRRAARDNVNWESECYTPLKCFMCSHTNRSGILNNGNVQRFSKSDSTEAVQGAFLVHKKVNDES